MNCDRRCQRSSELKLFSHVIDLDIVFAGEVGLLSIGEYADDFELLRRRGQWEVEEAVVLVDAWVECLVDFRADVEAESVDAGQEPSVTLHPPISRPRPG